MKTRNHGERETVLQMFAALLELQRTDELDIEAFVRVTMIRMPREELVAALRVLREVAKGLVAASDVDGRATPWDLDGRRTVQVLLGTDSHQGRLAAAVRLIRRATGFAQHMEAPGSWRGFGSAELRGLMSRTRKQVAEAFIEQLVELDPKFASLDANAVYAGLLGVQSSEAPSKGGRRALGATRLAARLAVWVGALGLRRVASRESVVGLPTWIHDPGDRWIHEGGEWRRWYKRGGCQQIAHPSAAIRPKDRASRRNPTHPSSSSRSAPVPLAM